MTRIELDDGEQKVAAACNCENAGCDHSGRCERPAGKGRVQWLGPVCNHCCAEYERLNPEYILVPHGTPLPMVR